MKIKKNVVTLLLEPNTESGNSFQIKFFQIWQPENTKKFTILKEVFTMKRKRLDSIQITQPQKDLDTM